MIRIAAIFIASLFAAATFTDQLNAAGGKRIAKPARNYEGGIKENPVTLTEGDSSGGLRPAAPPRPSGIKSLLPGNSGGNSGILGGGRQKPPKPIGRGATRSSPTHLPPGKIINQILPQVIDGASQLIKNRSNGEGILNGAGGKPGLLSGRRSGGKLMERMRSRGNSEPTTYAGGYEEDHPVLAGDDSTAPAPVADEPVPAPVENTSISQLAGDEPPEMNTSDELPQIPVTPPVQPPPGNNYESLADQLARDDARTLQNYFRSHERNARFIHTEMIKFRDRDAMPDYETRLNNYYNSVELYYAREIAELRKVEDTIMFSDFAKKMIADRYAKFEKERAEYNRLKQK